jgi:hypothetical protein
MNSSKLLVILFSTILLAACVGKKSDYVAVYKCDMDTQIAWTDSPIPGLVRLPFAKSGIYVCKIDSVNPYGPTFNMEVKNISENKFNHVKLSCWMKAESNNAEPSLVLDIHDAKNQRIEWLGKKVTGVELNTKDWAYYEYVINLLEKDRLKDSNVYRIYITNGKTSAVYCDDMELSFY